jgi:hypothetical protein
MSINNLEQERLTERLTEYIDGTLSSEEMKETLHWIESNEEIKVQYLQIKEILSALDLSQQEVPSGKMEARYEQWLDQETNQSSTKVISVKTWYKIAAAVLILLLAGTGTMTLRTLLKQKQELARVQDELAQTKQLVMTQLNNTQSASQRISAVYSTEEITKPDLDILRLLIRTMNEDPSSNVRMASLEALSKYYSFPEVREAFIQSMKFQKDPVVQIALIQLLVQRKEKVILQDLQNITAQNNIIKAVRDEAYKGIFKLT